MKRRVTQITAKSNVTSYVEINISNLKQNAIKLKEIAPAGIKTMAVVKANAYGHGAALVSHALSDSVTALGVASVEEAINIRNSGVILPILVFAPPRPGNVADYKTYNLVATVGSFDELGMMSSSMSFHLEFDTGMGRLGFDPDEWPEIHSRLQSNSLKPSGVMTHFASADAPDSTKVSDQLSRFEKLLENMGDWKKGKVIHASNSGGLLFYPEAAYSLVRFGLAVYGYLPSDTHKIDDLKPVLSWKSCVSACKPLRKGETVSYDANWTAPKDGWLVVVPVGYADGIRRGLSNKIEMSVGGNKIKQVGNVTMDYTMLFSDKPFETGEEVVILGDEAMQADEWAALLDTIPYEILCGIHPKIERRPVS
ncbi:MAG: alanine racemase [Balneolia bacterium]|nr:alanine racemase [Balneolia bacterium]